MKANEMFKSSRLLCARGCTDVAVGGKPVHSNRHPLPFSIWDTATELALTRSRYGGPFHYAHLGGDGLGHARSGGSAMKCCLISEQAWKRESRESRA